MDKSKVEVIKKWPTLHSVKDVQLFLGFANFYWRFIEGYSGIVLPLTQTTRKNVPWEWSEACQQAFGTLKSAFTSTPILHHWSLDHIPLVETDASDYAIAAVFSMSDPSDRILHPVAFHSQTLTGPELNYDIHDKELLAIYKAFCVWRHYLEGPLCDKTQDEPLRVTDRGHGE